MLLVVNLVVSHKHNGQGLVGTIHAGTVLPRLCHSEVLLKKSDAWIKIQAEFKTLTGAADCRWQGDAPALGSHESGHRHVPGVLDNY